MASPAEPIWRTPAAWLPAVHGVVESVLDTAVSRAVKDPLPVLDAERRVLGIVHLHDLLRAGVA